MKKPILLAALSSRTGFVNLKHEKYPGKLYVVTSPDKKSCDVINEISMEKYISFLLSKEMNSAWPIEALKAQAVAARTYALNKIETQQVTKKLGHEAYYDLESSEKHQVSGNLYDATLKTVKAAYDTKGYVLVTKDGNKLTPTFFHAKCGGHTLRPDQVWGNHVHGYHNVPCPNCRDHGKRSWIKRIDHKRMIGFLKWAQTEGHISSNVKIHEKNYLMLSTDLEARTYIRLYIDTQVVELKKVLFRRYFGRVMFPSNNFKLDKIGDYFAANGMGLGHGVGMCQLGALDMAQKGWNFEKILAHYFPGHVLKKLY